MAVQPVELRLAGGFLVRKRKNKNNENKREKNKSCWFAPVCKRTVSV